MVKICPYCKTTEDWAFLSTKIVCLNCRYYYLAKKEQREYEKIYETKLLEPVIENKHMDKYIFIYEANYPSSPEGFSFVDVNESTLEDAVRKFLEEMPNITKLIIVDIKHTYKIPIELYK